MITQPPANGETGKVLLGATKILDLGPGGISGLGVLTHRNKDGTGVCKIITDTFERINNEVGYKLELFDRDSDHGVKYAVNWLKEHGPKLVWTEQGETFVET
ncbi:hypothetical protein B9Z19DRAFT_1129225 [Tuber borchii]|uniref:Uncharacterized protein n=1 Tax=Tuber borchii TaxID=42251 RepID=A0A2T6ZMT5_TUBBO|nr:hypothetical protein B9Z19DRAFT_1129225 [Tuber borchii]